MGELRPVAIAVGVVHPDARDRTLVVRRAGRRRAAGYWTPVTGGVETGESEREACVREVAEEVGLEVEVLGGAVFRCPIDGLPADQYVLVWYRARVLGCLRGSIEALELARDEIDAAHWLTVDEIAVREPMFEATRAGFAALRAAAR